MYNDIAVRSLILAQMPGVEPWRMEMEDVDYGERMGVFYRSADKGVIRHSVIAKGRTDEEIASDFLGLLTGRSDEAADPIITATVGEPVITPDTIVVSMNASDVAPPNYEGRRGRHPGTCVCSKCSAKKSLNG